MIIRFKNKSYYLIILLCFFFLIKQTSPLFCQNDTTENKVRFDKDYVVSYWSDTKQIVASPFHWKARQWSTFAGVVGVTAIVYFYDEEIYNFFQKNNSETSENLTKYAIEPWGSGLYTIPLLGIIYLTGHNNNRHKKVALTGLKAFLLTGGATVVAKHLFHRHRPYQDEPPNPKLWEGPLEWGGQYTSFPSGHTSTAFAVASVLTSGYKDKLWVGITSYSVATLVGLSRIHDGDHWASDVLAGAALGTFIGTTLSRLNFNNIDINPTALNGGYGMRVVYYLR